ncbi:hypothetical protein EVAR_59849_1 [Eumeta japonica]|uniref:Uncharacterized protein n=1 Tax=Eumeta variegata TaxID=151549 RepID=A0A4C1Z9G6_EUMVA|nr:hypothetical protein EVAR_59849_1 [Eumeta japonica]
MAAKSTRDQLRCDGMMRPSIQIEIQIVLRALSNVVKLSIHFRSYTRPRTTLDLYRTVGARIRFALVRFHHSSLLCNFGTVQNFENAQIVKAQSKQRPHPLIDTSGRSQFDATQSDAFPFTIAHYRPPTPRLRALPYAQGTLRRVELRNRRENVYSSDNGRWYPTSCLGQHGCLSPLTETEEIEKREYASEWECFKSDATATVNDIVGKRVCGLIENRWSSQFMDIRNIEEVFGREFLSEVRSFLEDIHAVAR